MKSAIYTPDNFYFVAIILAALSFWSSGIMLIRFLAKIDVWSQSPQLWLVYGLSVPIIFVSIRGVQNLFIRFGYKQTGVVNHITGLVLMLHAIAVTIYPSLYFFTPGTSLYATTWLLWFGGVTILLQTRNTTSN